MIAASDAFIHYSARPLPSARGVHRTLTDIAGICEDPALVRDALAVTDEDDAAGGHLIQS